MIFKNISFMKINNNRVVFEPSPVLNLSLIDIDTNILPRLNRLSYDGLV